MRADERRRNKDRKEQRIPVKTGTRGRWNCCSKPPAREVVARQRVKPKGRLWPRVFAALQPNRLERLQDVPERWEAVPRELRLPEAIWSIQTATLRRARSRASLIALAAEANLADFAGACRYKSVQVSVNDANKLAPGQLKIRCDKQTQHKLPYWYTTNISLFSPANGQERALFAGFQQISYGLTILAVQWLVERRPGRGPPLEPLFRCQAARD